jgi:tRNA(Ile)-lysidine synthase
LPRVLTPHNFDRLLAAFSPFEKSPHLAIAVSGGGDSMALVLCADSWARAQGGRVTALTVDHGLRAGSAGEAAQVGNWLAARNINHEILTWQGEKPASGIQDAARQARYRLMENWCHDHHVLHLMLAHTLEDQAETYLMRMRRGSGPDGLAGMSTVREMQHCRLLRPLLGVTRDDLRQVLRDAGQAWLEDPSNADRRFQRVRTRQWLCAADTELSAGDVFESARRYGLARIVLERETDRLLAETCRLHAAGYAHLNRQNLIMAPEDLTLRALARVLQAVGGLPYPPRRKHIERLHRRLLENQSFNVTLGRCLLQVGANRIEIFRERRNLPATVVYTPGGALNWDGRFGVTFAKPPKDAGRRLRLRALSPVDCRDIAIECPEFQGFQAIPKSALWGLPALVDEHGIFSAPHVDYRRGAIGPAVGEDAGFRHARFKPLEAASIAGFCVASVGFRTMSMG